MDLVPVVYNIIMFSFINRPSNIITPGSPETSRGAIYPEAGLPSNLIEMLVGNFEFKNADVRMKTRILKLLNDKKIVGVLPSYKRGTQYAIRCLIEGKDLEGKDWKNTLHCNELEAEQHTSVYGAINSAAGHVDPFTDPYGNPVNMSEAVRGNITGLHSVQIVAIEPTK